MQKLTRQNLSKCDFCSGSTAGDKLGFPDVDLVGHFLCQTALATVAVFMADRVVASQPDWVPDDRRHELSIQPHPDETVLRVGNFPMARFMHLRQPPAPIRNSDDSPP